MSLLETQPAGATDRTADPALLDRLRAHLGRKIGVWLGLTAGICVPYYSLQRIDAFPLREVPALPLDRAIAFEPAWVFAYLSIALLVAIAPMLATKRKELAQYSVGLALLCTTCFAIFLFLPVAGPRPGSVPEHAVYRLLVSVDRPSNSMPSLHAGLVVYSLLFVRRVLRDGLDPGGRRALALGSAVWGGLILYSTLATKQHWVLDLPAGATVAWAAHAISGRVSPPAPERDAATR